MSTAHRSVVLPTKQHCRRGVFTVGAELQGQRPDARVHLEKIQQVHRAGADTVLSAEGLGAAAEE